MPKDRSNRPLASLGVRATVTVTTPPSKAPRPTARWLRKAEAAGAGPTVGVTPLNPEIQTLLDYAKRHIKHLDPWAVKFVGSLDGHINRKGGLTDKQLSVLREIASRP